MMRYRIDKGVFAKRLKSAIGLKYPSILSFCEYTGTARSVVNRYLAGDGVPNGSMVYNLAIELEVSADWLLGLTDYKGRE